MNLQQIMAAIAAGQSDAQIIAAAGASIPSVVITPAEMLAHRAHAPAAPQAPAAAAQQTPAQHNHQHQHGAGGQPGIPLAVMQASGTMPVNMGGVALAPTLPTWAKWLCGSAAAVLVVSVAFGISFWRTPDIAGQIDNIKGLNDKLSTMKGSMVPAAVVQPTGLTPSDLDAAIKRGADAALLDCYKSGLCVKKS
jgi:hypothetical protein